MTTTDLLSKLNSEIDAILPEIIALRQSLHREPELALQEHKTRAKILAAVQGEGVTLLPPLLGTDVIAEIGQGDRCIGLRADIDGLPILEETDLPYTSAQKGLMHACGHDGHTAILVGAMKVLTKLRHELPHRVRFIFQPGEEVRAAGRDLVDLGACDGLDEVYALHAWPGVPFGAISCKAGPCFAAAAFFTITVQGRGCHGAHPERGNNPIPIAARVVSCLLEEHQRLNARDGAIITTCAFNAGVNGNVIPNTATLQGTARYLRVEMADEMEQVVQKACDDIARESGATITLDYQRSYEIPVVNTQKGYENVRCAVTRALGETAFVEMETPTMGGEDFSYYLPGREGALLLLGQGVDAPGLHSTVFNFDDETISAGILTFCLLAFEMEC